ncbi:TetR/AcrR family transcriptional regulator [Roseospira marina]|uniref:TetR/AcrR family transcriptional regulator n=1 Tax=Roseospira marina TaxID=140057 RepID=UPI00182697BC|nr:TetR/AcrR family transcriptional regulator [Roseospira marina]MBB4315269.1 AcrR family transcriptional regulator [Roseospira marina]MBB5088269.1 AcrR family transcriptional regulator [Roseospira marina]
MQAAVHEAVRALQSEGSRLELTVPAIAARAGVTPSTIYRRWGDLGQLLSDVALDRLRPDSAPSDTGSFRGDMEAWLAQYIDDMASDFGRALLRDLLSSPTALNAGTCADALKAQFDQICARAEARGEDVPTSTVLMDHIFAPLVFRLLFSTDSVDMTTAETLLNRLYPVATPSDAAPPPRG